MCHKICLLRCAQLLQLCPTLCFSCVQPYGLQPTRLPPYGECMGFSRREAWSELPFPPPGDFPDPGIVSPASPALQADSLLLSHWGSPKIRLIIQSFHWDQQEKKSKGILRKNMTLSQGTKQKGSGPGVLDQGMIILKFSVNTLHKSIYLFIC